MPEYVNPYPQNISFDPETRLLTVTVKLSKEGRPSASEKSIIYYTTKGIIDIQVEGLRLNMTVLKRKPKEA